MTRKNNYGRDDRPGKAHWHHTRRMKDRTQSAMLATEERGMSVIPPVSLDIEQNEKLTIKQREFLAAFSEMGVLKTASMIAGTSVGTHKKWVLENEDYAEAFELAKQQACETLEAEARRRAVAGVKRYRFYKGKPIIDPVSKQPYYDLEYSDTLLILLMKANMPEKYKDRTETTVNGNMNNNIDAKVLLAKLPLELRKEIMKHLSVEQPKRLDGPGDDD